MRIVLTLFAILTLGVFGLVAAFDSGSVNTAVAVGTTTAIPTCGDDGDEGDGDPADEPDSDEDFGNTALEASDDDDVSTSEDSEDKDPVTEYDDCPPFDAEPTLGGESDTPAPTESPSDTPTETPFEDFAAVYNSDANCDGDTNSADALNVLRYTVGVPVECTGVDIGIGIAGDATCDEGIDNLDTLVILQVVSGIEDDVAC